jgi:hypothetical protein
MESLDFPQGHLWWLNNLATGQLLGKIY